MPALQAYFDETSQRILFSHPDPAPGSQWGIAAVSYREQAAPQKYQLDEERDWLARDVGMVLGGDDRQLYCQNRPFQDRGVVVIDIETGARRPWGDLFRALLPLYPDKDVIMKDHTASQRISSYPSAKGESSTFAYVVASQRKAVVFSTEVVQRACEDNAFDARQLWILSLVTPNMVTSIAARCPHVISLSNGGETCLHQCARQDMVDVIKSWLSSEEAQYVPIPNADGLTALEFCIEARSTQGIKILIDSLTPHLNTATGAHAVRAILALARTSPLLVPWALHAIEQKVFQLERRFRAPLAATLMRHSRDAYSPELFSDMLGESTNHAPELLVECKRVALPHFFGSVQSGSPFHQIVRKCGVRVYESKLMQLAVEWKWQAYCFRILMREVSERCLLSNHVVVA